MASVSYITPNTIYNALINDAIIATKKRNAPSATRVTGEQAFARSARVGPSSNSSSSSRLRTSSYAGV